MLAFNPGEPQFQNGTRPSQGREKDFLWGRCFLQLSVSSTSSAEGPTISGGVREGAWAIRDQLLPEQSCISCWGKRALHGLSFALAVAEVFSRQAGFRGCDAPETPQCWEGELGLAPCLPLPLTAIWSLHRWDQLVQVTDDLAQHKEQSNKHRPTPNSI